MSSPVPAGPRPVDVVVIGDCNPDLVLTGDVVPRFGQAEQLLEAAVATIGGSATIVACGTTRLGLATQLVAAVGADARGRDLVTDVAALGVGTNGVLWRGDVATGLSVILSSARDRAILTLPGAIPTLDPDEVDDHLLRSARHLHVASYFLIPPLAAGLPRLLERARAAGCTVSLDTNWDPAKRWAGVLDVLPLVDVLLPNQAELAAITGRDELDEAGSGLAARGPLVAVKLGAAGAVGFGPEGPLRVPGPAVEVVDTTGAGDSFDAGFLYAFLRGRGFGDCLRAATVAGSLSTRAFGGTPGQASAAELEAALSP